MIDSGFMGIVFCKNSYIGELFWHFRIYGYDFRKFSRFMGILLRNFFFFLYIPLKIYKTNYLLQYLLLTLRNTTRTIIPRGAIDYDNPVAINIERNKNYQVNQERCTACPQSRTQGPPADSHNSLRIYDALKRLLQNYAQASVEEFGIRIRNESGVWPCVTIYGRYFYYLNGTTPYLENPSYPPPRGQGLKSYQPYGLPRALTHTHTLIFYYSS